MNVLITGGAGYIGSVTARKFLDAGHRVFIVDDLSTGFAEAIPSDAYSYTYEILRDERKISEILDFMDIDTVLHFAAKSLVGESMTNSLDYYRSNIGGMGALLSAVKSSQVSRFVLSSSAAVYGAPRPDSMPIWERAALNPINPYGFSKVVCERMLEDYARNSKLSYLILRYFNVAGAGQRSKNATHLIKVACEVLTGKREYLPIYGNDYDTDDGTCIRDYVHVSDLADAHLLGAEYLSTGGRSEVFNVGYGRGFSVLEVISSLERVSGKRIPIKVEERRRGDPPILVADAKKIGSLNWEPLFADLDRITKSAYDWEVSL